MWKAGTLERSRTEWDVVGEVAQADRWMGRWLRGTVRGFGWNRGLSWAGAGGCMRGMKDRLLARWKSAGWNEFVLFTSVAAICVGVCLFIYVASAVKHETYRETEEHFMVSLRNPQDLSVPVGPHWLGEIGRDVSAIGGAVWVITLSLLVIGYLGMRKQWGRVALVVVTVAGGYVLSNFLKITFDRERPSVVPHLSEINSASFPSGHSMLSSLVYLTLGSLLAQAAERRREKVYFVSVAFFLTFVIGLSRVFLGVHYPTDVLAGWGAGMAWALLCWLVAAKFTPAREKLVVEG